MAPAQPVTRRELRRAEHSGLDRGHATHHSALPVPPPSTHAPGEYAGPDAAPLTRRALREAERREAGVPTARLAASTRPAPGRHTLAEASRAAHRAPVRRSPAARRTVHRGWNPVPGHGPALGMLMAVAFVLGALTSVQGATTERIERAQAAAVAAEEARVVRASAAAEARLTGQVMAHAAARRSQALDAAAEALAAADALLLDAVSVVGQDTTDPLVQATARLAALVEQAPAPELVLGGDAVTTASVSTPAEAEMTTFAADVTSVEPAPATAEPTAAPPDDLLAMGEVTTGPTERVVADAARALEALDGATSERLLEVAEEVTELVAEVRQAAAEAEAARVAAEQAAQTAEAARVAAEQAAAAELARKVAAADAAPNGEIPRSLLCGVSFDSTVLLRCDAAAAFEGLNAAFRAHFGRNISVSDSYRTYDEQVAAKANRGDLAAAPGTSNHGRGLAVDLDGFGDVGQFDRPYYTWMAAHARDHGWLHPSYMGPGGSGPLEPWHWEFGTG